LLVGLWVPAIGVAAAIGVILYFIGAVSFHVRAHDTGLVPPVVIGLLGVAALVLRLASV
jgi:DoxX-like family